MLIKPSDHKTPESVRAKMRNYRARRTQKMERLEKDSEALQRVGEALLYARQTDRKIPGIFASQDVYEMTEVLVKYLESGEPLRSQQKTKRAPLLGKQMRANNE